MFTLPSQFHTPPPLQPGDRLCVVSTSGSLRELDSFNQGCELWRQWGFEVIVLDAAKAQAGYLAGDDAHRRAALTEAWQDPQVKGILCSRGGYGSARLLEGWTGFATTAPKWLIGFSDVTGILWSLAKAGIVGVHGPVLTTVTDEPDWSLTRLKALLTGQPLPALTGQSWQGGKAQGRLIVANLTVATHLLGTPWEPDWQGVILAIEDVGEAPYRIDRMLTQWRLSGALDKPAGIALGRFSGCEAPAGFPSWTVEEALADRLEGLSIPIVSGLPFGHDGANAALPVGGWVELDGDQGMLTILPVS